MLLADESLRAKTDLLCPIYCQNAKRASPPGQRENSEWNMMWLLRRLSLSVRGRGLAGWTGKVPHYTQDMYAIFTRISTNAHSTLHRHTRLGRYIQIKSQACDRQLQSACFIPHWHKTTNPLFKQQSQIEIVVLDFCCLEKKNEASCCGVIREPAAQTTDAYFDKSPILRFARLSWSPAEIVHRPWHGSPLLSFPTATLPLTVPPVLRRRQWNQVHRQEPGGLLGSLLNVTCDPRRHHQRF